MNLGGKFLVYIRLPRSSSTISMASLPDLSSCHTACKDDAGHYIDIVGVAQCEAYVFRWFTVLLERTEFGTGHDQSLPGWLLG